MAEKVDFGPKEGTSVQATERNRTVLRPVSSRVHASAVPGPGRPVEALARRFAPQVPVMASSENRRFLTNSRCGMRLRSRSIRSVNRCAGRPIAVEAPAPQGFQADLPSGGNLPFGHHGIVHLLLQD